MPRFPSLMISVLDDTDRCETLGSPASGASGDEPEAESPTGTVASLRVPGSKLASPSKFVSRRQSLYPICPLRNRPSSLSQSHDRNGGHPESLELSGQQHIR